MTDSPSVPQRSPLLLLTSAAGGAAMVWFGLQKLGDPVAFLKAIHEYGIVPTGWPGVLNFLAVWIPALEVLGGLALVAGLARRPVAAVLSAMLVVFTALVAWRARGIHLEAGGSFCDVAFDCGCGTGEVFICTKLLENGLLLACCLHAALSARVRPFALGGEPR
jgi:uncharacterized membrane protein YphA (DoxX/SURF4 family)